MLAKCVYAESRGEPYVGQVAVAAVILNREKLNPGFQGLDAAMQPPEGGLGTEAGWPEGSGRLALSRRSCGCSSLGARTLG